MDEHLAGIAAEAIGFMPEEEGMALYRAGLLAADFGPLLEVGSFCGKSAIYLGAAAEKKMAILFSVDHHAGSEEHQPGQGYFDERLLDPDTGKVNTLPIFQRTIVRAGLENSVVAIIGESKAVAEKWTKRLGLVFIDGGHSEAAATADYEGWAPHVRAGGFLAIHDVFPDPAGGGQAPFHIYERALASENFLEVEAIGGLKILRRR
ncbi:MAG: class I SAM-dependent methyltransferase [Actinobacteria bacterium]|nr:class I SAM-dependent methyltransferase [Actinomycetota bacterium]